MKKFLENKIVMIGAVIALLKQNITLWASSTVFKGAVADLEAIKARIDNVRNDAEQTTKGPTTAKGIHREELENKVFEIISVISAMATRTRDKSLQADMNHTLSDLQYMRGSKLLTLSAHVAAVIRANVSALKEYSITDESATMLDSLCGKFSSKQSTPRIVVSERRAAHESLDSLFGEADDIMQGVIDKLMVPYKTSNPDFYAAYKSARKIVNYGVRHQKEEKPKADEGEK